MNNKNRKIFLILLAIVVGVVLVVLSISDDKHHGNKLTMSYLNTEKSEVMNEKFHAIIEIENSVSMKGFVVPRQGMNCLNMTFEPTIGDLVSNLNHDTTISSTKWCCGSRSGKSTSDLYNNGLKEGRIFTGSSTQLEQYISKVGSKANDSVVAMFVSDMVFSLAQMNGDACKIVNNVNKLKTLVTDSLKGLESKKIHLLMLQYTSDFNGQYYYNCTNNLRSCSFRGELLKKRPYYVLVFGTKQNLNYLVTQNKLPKCENMWSTYTFDESNYTSQGLNTYPDKHWKNFDQDQANPVFTFWTDNDWEMQTSEVEIELTQTIKLPDFLENWQPVCDSRAVSCVTKISGSDTKIKVSVKSFDQLAREEDVEIKLISSRSSWDACNIDDDILPLDSVRLLDGKTWGFSYLMEAIKDVYPTIDDSVIVGEFNFKFMKE